MSSSRPVIAITPGEPAGIGPELVLQLLGSPVNARVVVIADSGLLAERARRLDLDATLPDWAGQDEAGFYLLPVTLNRRSQPGVLDPANADYVLEALDVATDGCLRHEFDAMVTGPVHKAVINQAGHDFTGHTEYLAQRSNTNRVVMMLTGGGMRVALATTHLPLVEVPAAITADLLEHTLRIIDHGLRKYFGLERPRISVCGLNPHAGEDGHLGREEIEIMQPVINRLTREGLDVSGPIPADTAFTQRALQGADVVLAMYHDQGLAVLKHASFGKAINITLGLPFIRTSVDHGTALELAGTGKASTDSLVEAMTLAIDLARP